MKFACCFPGCDRTKSNPDVEQVSKLRFPALIDNGWLFLEAPSLCYEWFAFCSEHGDMIKHKQEESPQPAGQGWPVR